MRADFITISQPTAAYVHSTTLLDFTDPDYTQVGGLAGSGEQLTYDNLLTELTVPLNWSSWGSPPATETATPRVGWTDGSSELTISLSVPARAFGFEIEPDNPYAEQITAAFYSGTTVVGTISLTPNGNAGALLYAASTTTSPFSRVVINNLASDDFAIARQRFVLATPEPRSFGLAVLALTAIVALGVFGRRRPA